SVRLPGAVRSRHRARDPPWRAAGEAPQTETGHRRVAGRLLRLSRRLFERVDAGRPISHVAAEAGISRRRLAKWHARWPAEGEDGLHDHTSRPAASPNRTSDDVADLVEALRRQTKHEPARLASDLSRIDTGSPCRRSGFPCPAPQDGPLHPR